MKTLLTKDMQDNMSRRMLPLIKARQSKEELGFLVAKMGEELPELLTEVGDEVYGELADIIMLAESTRVTLRKPELNFVIPCKKKREPVMPVVIAMGKINELSIMVNFPERKAYTRKYNNPIEDRIIDTVNECLKVSSDFVYDYTLNEDFYDKLSIALTAKIDRLERWINVK